MLVFSKVSLSFPHKSQHSSVYYQFILVNHIESCLSFVAKISMTQISRLFLDTS